MKEQTIDFISRASGAATGAVVTVVALKFEGRLAAAFGVGWNPVFGSEAHASLSLLLLFLCGLFLRCHRDCLLLEFQVGPEKLFSLIAGQRRHLVLAEWLAQDIAAPLHQCQQLFLLSRYLSATRARRAISSEDL